ncbi:MarR family transcriptional regulator [Sphingomonas hankyongi]|uniref:MarR family transcriptional regulator n=1 Tax=Sphingomonas hankyongi TaxID=2908209 RepID=A0ABT0RYJ9_9SPHN|nr:MarR family transcriptional regulator [Sphingomonas hankyongi]MCL6728662.1 MarR family transcriptional regulator [Sphingomonas hankyongi]
MDAHSIGRSFLDPCFNAPVLIAGSSPEANDKAAHIIEGAGLRVADKVQIRAAVDSIDRQLAASAVWLELGHEDDSLLDELLDRVNRDVSDGRYAAVIATPMELLDVVTARAREQTIEVVVGPNEADRAAALATALANSRVAAHLSDIAADKNAVRIRQLSEEVSRIASTLARLSEGPSMPARRPTIVNEAGMPDVAAERIRAVIRARRLRSRYFPEELFADPAWDMLLDLLQAEISHLRVPVSSLCIAAAVPATTALRWLKAMVQEGLFVRRADPHDGRRVFVELAPHTSQALRRYFNDVDEVAVI